MTKHRISDYHLALLILIAVMAVQVGIIIWGFSEP
jgi:hypothetical protein